MLAIKHHCYPRKRLYVPTEDDVSMFPTMNTSRCTVAFNQGGKEETVVQDDFNERLATPMSDWWTGETYFDLQGRDPGELKVAVAATRRGKPIRDKGQAKKEVKSNRFVTIGDDQKNMRVGCMTKPVNRVTYDMADFLETDIQRLQVFATGYLPAPGRTRQQVILGAGSHADFQASRSEVHAKLVMDDGVAIEELKNLGLADDEMTLNMSVGWHGTFMDAPTFAGLALGNEDARKVLTFNGLVSLQATTLDTLKTEVLDLIAANYAPAQAKIRSDQPARARQAEISKAKSKAAPAAPRQRWSDADWERWQHGGYYGRTWYSSAEWRRYWGQ